MGKRERGKRRQEERKQVENRDQLALAGRGRLGMGRPCLLKGQGTQGTGQASITIITIITHT